jgi:hypothetical protein
MPARTKPKFEESGEVSRLGVHMGNSLHDYARDYPNLMLTLAECVQNAIDADASRVLIGIQLKHRIVVVADNGAGVTKEMFDQALSRIGFSRKDEGKLGRFGRGLVSPLDKCRFFTFTSWPRGQKEARQWLFESAALKNIEEAIDLRPQRMVGLANGLAIPVWLKRVATDEFNRQWRTVVTMNQVTADKVVSLVEIDELEATIRRKYGRQLLEKNVSVRILLIDVNGREQLLDIHPKPTFSGEALEPVERFTPATGKVRFELYIAPKRSGERKGEVSIMELDGNAPVGMLEFMRQAIRGEWREVVDEALKALNSGHFEGTIYCENIELLPERTKFNYTEALHELYFVINEWYEQIGKTYLQNEQEQTKEQRYQELGTRSLQHLRDVLLTGGKYNDLWVGLRSVVKVGRLGEGHVTPLHGRRNGKEKAKSMRATGSGTIRTQEGGSHSQGSKTGEHHDRPGDIPTGTLGPKGTRRTVIQGDSQGLWFEHSWMRGNILLWEFDFETGTLRFNVRHPIWVGLDETNGKHLKKNELWIMKLQEYIALELLTLLNDYRTPAELEAHRHRLDDKILAFVELILKS